MSKKSLIEELHDLQDDQGDKHYLPEQGMRDLARKENISLSKAYGVATFYTMYATKPRGKYIIRICENQTCHMAEAKKVIRHLQDLLSVEIGETTKDGLFTLELSSCLGMCSVAPSMMIDEIPYGNLTPDKVTQIIVQLKDGGK